MLPRKTNVGSILVLAENWLTGWKTNLQEKVIDFKFLCIKNIQGKSSSFNWFSVVDLSLQAMRPSKYRKVGILNFPPLSFHVVHFKLCLSSILWQHPNFHEMIRFSGSNLEQKRLSPKVSIHLFIMPGI